MLNSGCPLADVSKFVGEHSRAQDALFKNKFSIANRPHLQLDE